MSEQALAVKTAEEQPSEASDGAEVAIEEGRNEEAGSGRSKAGVMERGDGSDGSGIERGPEPGEKAGEADAS